MTTDEYQLDSIVEGLVTNITKFGVFIKLPNGNEGLVHISEIADEYVTDIKNYINLGEKVNIKILAKNENNRLDLSIKKAKTPSTTTAPTEENQEFTPFLHKKSKSDDLEKKIDGFLKKAEEKQIDLKRNLKFKQGVSKKRK